MVRVYEMQNPPTTAEYVQGLKAIRSRVSDAHRRVFVAHHAAVNRTATAKQLAARANLGGHSVVNSLYGKLGHVLCDELGVTPELRPNHKNRWWSVWARGWSDSEGFVWQMLPQVAEALEEVGICAPERETSLPEEVEAPPGRTLTEGAVRQIAVNAYERSREAVRKCKERHGTACVVCGFNFGVVYGPVAERTIHVHHLRPISEVGAEYMVNPETDLVPVCPNCHVVLHLGMPGGGCRSVEDVQRLIEANRRRSEPDAAGCPSEVRCSRDRASLRVIQDGDRSETV